MQKPVLPSVKPFRIERKQPQRQLISILRTFLSYDGTSSHRLSSMERATTPRPDYSIEMLSPSQVLKPSTTSSFLDAR